MPGLLLPGLEKQARTLRELFEEQGNILIYGPRGAGKSSLLNQFLESKGLPQALDCLTNPYVKDGSATPPQSGILSFKDFDKLERDEQASILAEPNRRIFATSSTPTDFDHLFISIDVPGISQRREDIFFFIGEKFPDLELSRELLFQLASETFPNNLYDIEALVKKWRSKDSYRRSEVIVQDACSNAIECALVLLVRSCGFDEVERFNRDCLNGLLPLPGDQLGLPFAKIENIGLLPPIKSRIVPAGGGPTIDPAVLRGILDLFFGRHGRQSSEPQYTQELFSQGSLEFIKDNQEFGSEYRFPGITEECIQSLIGMVNLECQSLSVAVRDGEQLDSKRVDVVSEEILNVQHSISSLMEATRPISPLCSENGQEAASALELPPVTEDREKKGRLITGKDRICELYGCKVGSYDNTVPRMAKKHGRKIFHLDGSYGPPSMYEEDIRYLRGSKHKRAIKK